ncbi:MAG: hypothetical protein IT355_20325 [Gemmatimonadaceae bacterium]|nr:hypothetical protein [Gemmatimonadaceae bacterium]
MRITNQRSTAVFWRTFNRGETVYGLGVAQGEIAAGAAGPVTHPDATFKMELKVGSFWGPYIEFPGAIHRADEQLILTADGRIVVDTGGAGNGAEVHTRVYANEVEKARFADANDRSLAALVPDVPNDPPVAAYPTFDDSVSATGEQIRQLVVLRRSAAEVVLVPFGNSPAELQAVETDTLPLLFSRAGWLTLDPTASLHVNAPELAPGAVWTDVYWGAFPTCLISVGPGPLRRKQMAIVKLRRPIAGTANPNVRVALVPVDQIPCHPSDTGRAPTLTPGDLANPDAVGIVMRAVQRFAITHGYSAGLAAFGNGSELMVRVALIRGAEVVNVGSRSSRRAFWQAGVIGTPVMTGSSAPWGVTSVPLPGTGAAVFTSSDTGLVMTLVGNAPNSTSVTLDASAGRRAPLTPISFQVSACRAGPLIHVLYCDGRLLHRSLPVSSLAAPTGSMVVIDGDGTRVCGAASAIVTRFVGGVDELHAFYLETGTAGSTDQSLRDNLRHARFTPTTGWVHQPADGHVDGPDGQLLTVIEPQVAALVLPDGTIEAYYYDRTNGALRRCLMRPGATVPSDFGVIDGGGTRVGLPPGTGPTSARVGSFPSAVIFDGAVHLFYGDMTNANIRWAKRPLGDHSLEAWRFGVLDGAGGRRGATRNNVIGPRACIWNGRLSVAYGDNTAGLIRHATMLPGESWTHETIDSGLAAPALTASEGNTLPLVLAYREIDATAGRLRAAILSPP